MENITYSSIQENSYFNEALHEALQYSVHALNLASYYSADAEWYIAYKKDNREIIVMDELQSELEADTLCEVLNDMLYERVHIDKESSQLNYYVAQALQDEATHAACNAFFHTCDGSKNELLSIVTTVYKNAFMLCSNTVWDGDDAVTFSYYSLPKFMDLLDKIVRLEETQNGNAPTDSTLPLLYGGSYKLTAYAQAFEIARAEGGKGFTCCAMYDEDAANYFIHTSNNLVATAIPTQAAADNLEYALNKDTFNTVYVETDKQSLMEYYEQATDMNDNTRENIAALFSVTPADITYDMVQKIMASYKEAVEKDGQLLSNGMYKFVSIECFLFNKIMSK